MRKFLLACLCIILVLTVTACGKKPSQTSSSASISTISEDFEEKPASTEVSTETSISTEASVSDTSTTVDDEDDEDLDTTVSVSVSEDKQVFLDIYDELEGNYQDSVSQRASMTIKSFDCICEVKVSWASSDELVDEWEFTATYKDGKLSYEDCCHSQVTYKNEEAIDYDIKTIGEFGYFEYKNGMLYWSGAADSDCKECIFEKMP